jgi:hypothetical protein
MKTTAGWLLASGTSLNAPNLAIRAEQTIGSNAGLSSGEK